MSASQARHDDSTLVSISTRSNNPPAPTLTFTSEEIDLLDPLERLAFRLMVTRGKAVIQEAG